MSSEVVRFMRRPESRLWGFLGGGAGGSRVPRESRVEPRRGVPHSCAGGGVAGEAPIFRIEAAAHQPPLGRPDPGRCDAGHASAEPGREGGEVAAGGNDPEFLIRVPLGAQGFGRSLSAKGTFRGVSVVAIRGAEDGISGLGDELVDEALAVVSNTARSLGRTSQSKKRLPSKVSAWGDEPVRSSCSKTKAPRRILRRASRRRCGFGGAIELGEFGLELGALRLEGFEGFGFLLIDGGEFGFNILRGWPWVHVLCSSWSFDASTCGKN